MNIVTPVPTNIVFTTANVNTESARRDNVQRETVPQTSESENSAAESGLGSESDRIKSPGRAPQPVTYERPANGQLPVNSGGRDNQQDNAEDPSAGRQDAEQRQQQQQEAAEQQEIEQLKQRDREVRAHEQAHASRGGQYAGAPSYEFERGPDGRQYAVGGEVSIDISEESTPQETLRKMEQVKAAALAPAEPSAQDLSVANEATQKANQARSDIATEQQREQRQNTARQSGEIGPNDDLEPDLLEQIQGRRGPGNTAPNRSLKEDDPVAEAAGLETGGEEFRAQFAAQQAINDQRNAVIQSFYQNVSSPRAQGLQFSA